jgi:hypothetical protein
MIPTGEPGADARKDSGAAGQVRSGPATVPVPQAIDGLTVERLTSVSDCGIAGAWWIWRRDGKQVHAGLDARQFVGGQFYRLVGGKWERETT